MTFFETIQRHKAGPKKKVQRVALSGAKSSVTAPTAKSGATARVDRPPTLNLVTRPTMNTKPQKATPSPSTALPLTEKLPPFRPLSPLPSLGSVWSTGGAAWEVNPDVNFNTIIRGALFSPPGREHRMRLIRQWGNEHFVMFLMHNPSIANERIDDPTTLKVCKYAQSWGYGGVLIGNLATFVTEKPEDLLHVSKPIAPYNDSHLAFMALRCKLVVLAYGQPSKHAMLRDEGQRVEAMLAANCTTPLRALKRAKDGSPYHPLYLPDNLTEPQA